MIIHLWLLWFDLEQIRCASNFADEEDNESVINSSTYRGLVGSTMQISIAQKSVHSKSSEKSMLWPSEAGIGDSDDDIIMEFTVISPMDGDTEVEESDEDESDENESVVSFYKLDIQSIRVISFFRAQVCLISSTLKYLLISASLIRFICYCLVLKYGNSRP